MFFSLPCLANQPWAKYEACPHLDVYRLQSQNFVNIRLNGEAKKYEYEFEYVGQACSTRDTCATFKLNGSNKIKIEFDNLSLKSEELIIHLEKPGKYKCTYAIFSM